MHAGVDKQERVARKSTRAVTFGALTFLSCRGRRLLLTVFSLFIASDRGRIPYRVIRHLKEPPPSSSVTTMHWCSRGRKSQMYFLFVIGCCLSLFTVETVVAAPSVREADIMSCALCTLVTETAPTNAEPAIFFQAMFSRCARMGLMAPACEQLIEDHAKRIFLLVRNGVEPKDVCVELRLCR